MEGIRLSAPQNDVQKLLGEMRGSIRPADGQMEATSPRFIDDKVPRFACRRGSCLPITRFTVEGDGPNPTSTVEVLATARSVRQKTNS